MKAKLLSLALISTLTLATTSNAQVDTTNDIVMLPAGTELKDCQIKKFGFCYSKDLKMRCFTAGKQIWCRH